MVSTPNVSIDVKLPPNFPVLNLIYKKELTVFFGAPTFELNNNLTYPECDWSISEMHESGFLTHENYTFDFLQNIANKS